MRLCCSTRCAAPPKLVLAEPVQLRAGLQTPSRGRLRASYGVRVGAGRPGNPGAVAQVEAFDEVERAFVHVDWAHREEPEHKARPPLTLPPLRRLAFSL